MMHQERCHLWLVCHIVSNRLYLPLNLDDGVNVNSVTAQHQQSRSVLHTSGGTLGMSYHIQWLILIVSIGGDNDTAMQQQQAHAFDGQDPAHPCLPQSEDIVNVHHRHNHAPRSSSNTQLLAARMWQTLSTNQVAGEALHSNDNGQESPTVSQTGQEPNTGLQTGFCGTLEHAEQWQLQYYDPPTHDIIKYTKQFSHCNATSIDAFSVCAVERTRIIW